MIAPTGEKCQSGCFISLFEPRGDVHFQWASSCSLHLTCRFSTLSVLLSLTSYFGSASLPVTGTLGDHGYDPSSPLMHHPLLARGPAFRRQFQYDTLLENVDLAWLAALVLQLNLPPGSVNGSRARVQPLLAPSGAAFWAGGSGAAFWAAGQQGGGDRDRAVLRQGGTGRPNRPARPRVRGAATETSMNLWTDILFIEIWVNLPHILCSRNDEHSRDAAWYCHMDQWQQMAVSPESPSSCGGKNGGLVNDKYTHILVIGNSVPPLPPI